MNEAVQSAVTSLVGGVVVVEDAAVPDLGVVVENEEEVEDVHNTTLLSNMNSAPAPLTTPEELALFMDLHDEMVYPGGITDGAAMPMDFELLKDQFNRAVAKKWKDNPANESNYKMKTATLLMLAYNRAAESAQTNKLIAPKLELVQAMFRNFKDDSGFVFPDIKEREDAPVAVPPPPPPPPLRAPAAPAAPALPAAPAAPAPVVDPMDVEEEEVAPIRVEDYNWVPSRSTTKTKIKQRIKYLKTSRWCPKEGCHKMCVMVSGGKSKVVNGHCESSRTSGGSSYPDCGEQGEVSRNDVHKWTISSGHRERLINWNFF